MFYKYFLVFILSTTISFAAGLFDFFSSSEPQPPRGRTSDIDMNQDFIPSSKKVKREDSVIELIPYLSYGYSKLAIDYSGSSDKTEAIDSKVELGISLNTAFNYFGSSPFGYMLNFNYESYNFDEDEVSGSVQTDISGNIIKVAPLLFFSFDVNSFSVYTSFGLGVAKYDLSGTNNYSEQVTMDDFSLLTTYKVEVFYGKVILTLLQENSTIEGNGFESELNETHVKLGYLISF